MGLLFYYLFHYLFFFSPPPSPSSPLLLPPLSPGIEGKHKSGASLLCALVYVTAVRGGGGPLRGATLAALLLEVSVVLLRDAAGALPWASPRRNSMDASL